MKLIVKVGGKVLTSLPEEGAVGGAINAGKEKPKARTKLIVKVGGKVLTSLPEEGAIQEGGAIKYGAGREKLSPLKLPLPPSRTSKKKSSLPAKKKKLDMEAVKTKPKHYARKWKHSMRVGRQKTTTTAMGGTTRTDTIGTSIKRNFLLLICTMETTVSRRRRRLKNTDNRRHS